MVVHIRRKDTDDWQIHFMKTKQEIVENWLPRYTGRKLEVSTEYIVLTNFNQYVESFARMNNVDMIHIGMGSANAATIRGAFARFGSAYDIHRNQNSRKRQRNRFEIYIRPPEYRSKGHA
jgi:hypothetical protein